MTVPEMNLVVSVLLAAIGPILMTKKYKTFKEMLQCIENGGYLSRCARSSRSSWASPTTSSWLCSRTASSPTPTPNSSLTNSRPSRRCRPQSKSWGCRPSCTARSATCVSSATRSWSGCRTASWQSKTKTSTTTRMSKTPSNAASSKTSRSRPPATPRCRPCARTGSSAKTASTSQTT